MRIRLAALLMAACAACGSAAAQETAATAPRPECPASGRDLPPAALYGNWEARFEGIPGIATVQLAKHPDYAGVRGTITRTGSGNGPTSVAQLAGDVDDDGLLGIDESRDGRSISGVWSGELQPASCGKEFRGTWRNASDESTYPFVLNKVGSWR
ncbi:MAG: hypothetical protein EOP82_18005 [Variovorax sp.]|nr:MAG: hypothetical protein EOP82_18005 [Variovorax sp.]